MRTGTGEAVSAGPGRCAWCGEARPRGFRVTCGKGECQDKAVATLAQGAAIGMAIRAAFTPKAYHPTLTDRRAA